jgi:trans-aconitate methyltransferase
VTRGGLVSLWENYATHERLLTELFEGFEKEKEYRILDAGSGRTSLYFLTNRFPNSRITAIVYPSDRRKSDSISRFVPRENFVLKEVDIRNFGRNEKFDIVLAHLLLGEATLFGNTFDDVLGSLFSMTSEYLVIVDVLEDSDVDYRAILRAIGSKGSLVNTVFLDRYIGFLVACRQHKP